MGWCSKNNLILNEIIVDFTKKQPSHAPLHQQQFCGDGQQHQVPGVHITDNLTWSVNTAALVKKAQQCLHFLRRMRKALLPPPIFATFYRSTVASILTSCISMWCGSCKASDWRNLRRVVRTSSAAYPELGILSDTPPTLTLD